MTSTVQQQSTAKAKLHLLKQDGKIASLNTILNKMLLISQHSKEMDLFNPTQCCHGASSRLAEGEEERVEGQELRGAGGEHLCLTGLPHGPPLFSNPCRDQ